MCNEVVEHCDMMHISQLFCGVLFFVLCWPFIIGLGFTLIIFISIIHNNIDENRLKYHVRTLPSHFETIIVCIPTYLTINLLMLYPISVGFYKYSKHSEIYFYYMYF